jgi:hypothetical protein
MSKFDPTRTLVMTAFGSLREHNVHGGAPITIVPSVTDDAPAGHVSAEEAEALWSTGKIIYSEDARPTPVETPEQEANRLTDIEQLDGGWWMIRAPWLEEAIKVQGETAAFARRDEVIADRIAAAGTPPVVIQQDPPSTTNVGTTTTKTPKGDAPTEE